MNLVRLASGGTTPDAFKDFKRTKKLAGKKLDPNKLVEPRFLTVALKEVRLESYGVARKLAPSSRH